jgi:hypothetical protein
MHSRKRNCEGDKLRARSCHHFTTVGVRPPLAYCVDHACNETNLMHNLSSVYSVTIPLHVSGLLVAHHQEVKMHICNKWYMLYFLHLVDRQLAWLRWDCEKINSTLSWSYYMHISRCTVKKRLKNL